MTNCIFSDLHIVLLMQATRTTIHYTLTSLKWSFWRCTYGSQFDILQQLFNYHAVCFALLLTNICVAAWNNITGVWFSSNCLLLRLYSFCLMRYSVITKILASPSSFLSSLGLAPQRVLPHFVCRNATFMFSSVIGTYVYCVAFVMLLLLIFGTVYSAEIVTNGYPIHVVKQDGIWKP